VHNPQKRFWRDPVKKKALTESAFLLMPGVNRQGQAHIVSTAIVSPGSGKGGREVEAAPLFRTWFSIDPQPASISPTINISIVFICAFLVDCGRTIGHPAIKTILARSCEAGRGFVAISNETATTVRLPSIAVDFESSASANFATPAARSLKLRTQKRSSSASQL